MFLVDLPHGMTAVFDGSGVFLNAHYDDHIDHDDEGGHHDDDGYTDDPNDALYTFEDLPQPARDWIWTSAHATASAYQFNPHSNIKVAPHDFHDEG